MGALDGEVQLPAVGGVPKKILIPVAVAAAGFVVWRWWASRNAAADAAADPIVDGEFGAIDTSIPGVIGAVKAGNAYGRDDGDSGDPGQAPITTNDAWSRAATAELVQGDRYSYSDITAALGNYLGGQPLSTSQQEIVRAAIAIRGYPPVGTHAIVAGGNTALTLAPGSPRVQAVTATSVTIAFTPVAGAVGYRVYQAGKTGAVGSYTRSPITVNNLQPNSSYSFTVKGHTSAADGPASSPVAVKTPAVALGVPATPSVSNIGRTSVAVRTGAVSGATSYRWYLKSSLRAVTPGPAATLAGLAPGTAYTVTVQAERTGQQGSRGSGARSFKTKK